MLRADGDPPRFQDGITTFGSGTVSAAIDFFRLELEVIHHKHHEHLSLPLAVARPLGRDGYAAGHGRLS